MSTFHMICAIVFALLILNRISPNFVRLAPGETYRTRTGDVVKIKHQIRQGPYDIFIGTSGVRYFADGQRVGDLTAREHRLFKRI